LRKRIAKMGMVDDITGF